MKIVAYELGQIIYLLPNEEFRPDHGIHPSNFVSKMVDRYKFLNAPDLANSFDHIMQEGFKFQSGRILKDGVETNINEFGIYSDGFVVNCYTTDDAEYFLRDALEWSHSEFGLKKPHRSPDIRYHSRVIAEFEKETAKLITNFSKIAKILTKKYSEVYELDAPVHLNRLSFRCDPLTLLKNAPETDFMIERRVNRPFDEECYMSWAPLTTEAHIELLQSLENLV